MKVLSNWRSVRLWETELERDLHQRHSLRTHGLLIGTFTLLLMWGVSALQMWLGVDSLAVRYAVTLGAGYAGYLVALRWWAQWLVKRENDNDLDIPDIDLVRTPEPRGAESGGGGDFGGGGASGDFEGAAVDASTASAAEGVGDLASALEAAGSADEGAIIVVPVVAVFLIGVAIVTGAGSLALLYFGWDALLAVAVEVAFSYASARAAMRVAREGWLSAAVRLTWKPLLGALACAVALGATLDHFMPQVNSLPEAVRVLRGA
ncbi:MAG: hypothetical protein EOP81_11010 [Variovorax sp.]|nr:MAG: hypothetical protein EOP81_11010 [Variovorax sp.]